MKIHKKAVMCKQRLKIPSRIVLLGITYKILIDSELRKGGGRMCLGSVNFETKTIRLRKGWKDIRQVLYHECAHICSHHTKIAENECNDEIFAQTVGMFFEQVADQLEVISSIPRSIPKTKLKSKRKKLSKKILTKSSRRKK